MRKGGGLRAGRPSEEIFLFECLIFESLDRVGLWLSVRTVFLGLSLLNLIKKTLNKWDFCLAGPIPLTVPLI